jgi:hypothetical protein
MTTQSSVSELGEWYQYERALSSHSRGIQIIARPCQRYFGGDSRGIDGTRCFSPLRPQPSLRDRDDFLCSRLADSIID